MDCCSRTGSEHQPARQKSCPCSEDLEQFLNALHGVINDATTQLGVGCGLDHCCQFPVSVGLGNPFSNNRVWLSLAMENLSMV